MLRFEEMLILQEGVNSLINPNWRAAKNPWYRAIWVECAELADHMGWKWWKKQNPDAQQIELELVDIFHFGLSDLLQNGSVETVVEQCNNAYLEFSNAQKNEKIEKDAAVILVEEFSLDVLKTKRFRLGSFFELSSRLHLSELSLYEKYVGKNVLNRFRQDHGYKNGSYIKNWLGREDNEWLAEISARAEKIPAKFATEIYERLAGKYAEVTSGH